MFSPRGNRLNIREALSKGKWFWRLTLFHNRLRLASSDVSWFTLAHSINPPDVATVPQSRSKNNKARSFFPIGLYQAEIEAFEEYGKAGFNLVQSYNSESNYIKDFVKAAANQELSALVTKRMTRTEPGLSKFFREMSEEPGLFGWYIEDEPEGRGVSPSLLWKWRHYILSNDPNHPTAVANVRSRKVKDYSAAVDIIMVDPYPIPHMPVTWLSDSIDEAQQAVADKKPVWAVIQAFNWADQGSQFAKGQGRYPTLKEERCLSYLSIVHGVKGLMYFSYKAARMNDPGETNWRNVKSIVSELREIQPLLMAPNLELDDSLSVLDFTGTSDTNMQDKKKSASQSTKKIPIHYAIKKVGSSQSMKSGVYIIAVNVSSQPMEARFKGSILSGRTAHVLFEERRILITTSGFQDRFDPLGVHIYRIE